MIHLAGFTLNVTMQAKKTHMDPMGAKKKKIPSFHVNPTAHPLNATPHKIAGLIQGVKKNMSTPLNS